MNYLKLQSLTDSTMHWLLQANQQRWGRMVSVRFSSVAQSCLTLCDPVDCSMPGFPVHHLLPELTQAHVHWVGDTIQPSHPLWSPSPPAFSQHQGLFRRVSSPHQVAKVLTSKNCTTQGSRIRWRRLSLASSLQGQRWLLPKGCL